MPFFLIFAGAGILQGFNDWGLRRTAGVLGGLVGLNLLIAWQAEWLRAVLHALLYGLDLK